MEKCNYGKQTLAAALLESLRTDRETLRDGESSCQANQLHFHNKVIWRMGGAGLVQKMGKMGVPHDGIVMAEWP